MSRSDQVASDGPRRCCGSGGRLHHGPGLRYHHLAGKRLYSCLVTTISGGCFPPCLLGLPSALAVVFVCESHRPSSCSRVNLTVHVGPWLRAHGVCAAGPSRRLRPAVDVDQAHAQQRRRAARSASTPPTTAPLVLLDRPSDALCFLVGVAQACMRRVWLRMGGWWTRSRLRRRRCGSPRHCSSPTDDGTPQALSARTPHSHLGGARFHCRMLLPACATPVTFLPT